MKKTMLIILLVLSSGYANAYHFCKGKIQTVWVEGDGDVYIVGSWIGKHTRICNVNREWKSIEVDSCKTWVSIAQLAYAAKSDVVVRYNDDATNSCAELPDYGDAPAPNYVMITQFEE